MTLASPRALQGRTIVITGGAGALGRAVVHRLAEAGAEIVVPCIENEPPDLAGARCVAGVNLSEEADVVAFYRELPALWASIHIAGGFAWARVADTGAELVRAQWAMNAMTCFLCCREAVKTIRARGGGGGRLVNVGSRATRSPGAGTSAYTMAKAAVEALTLQLAEELKEEQILVNAIAPGIIDTMVNRADMPKADHSRWPRPEELAFVVHQLVSPELTTTSGAVVPVYGRS